MFWMWDHHKQNKDLSKRQEKNLRLTNLLLRPIFMHALMFLGLKLLHLRLSNEAKDLNLSRDIYQNMKEASVQTLSQPKRSKSESSVTTSWATPLRLRWASWASASYGATIQSTPRSRQTCSDKSGTGEALNYSNPKVYHTNIFIRTCSKLYLVIDNESNSQRIFCKNYDYHKT